MSQKPSVDLVPSWHAAAPPESEAMSRDALRRKLIGPVTYTQPSGADTLWEMVMVVVNRLRRA